MYERFTDRARKVMLLANQEAQRFNHEYIGTEHILLGLIKASSGVAANVLVNLGIDLRTIRTEVERLVQSGPDMVSVGKLPQTPRSKKVIEYAMEESRNLNHNYVGTEHILLGLLREQEGVAGQVLTKLGLRLEAVRDEVLKLLGPNQIVHDTLGKGKSEKPIRRIFDYSPLTLSPLIKQRASEDPATADLIAADIGNCRIKLGRFSTAQANPSKDSEGHPKPGVPLPEPIATCELTIDNKTGEFDPSQLAEWCNENVSAYTRWHVASVHRAAGELFVTTVADWAMRAEIDWPIHRLTYRDVPLLIRVEEPARVGIDRLLAAVAANRLRQTDRAAIIVDLGTAITVDLLAGDGAFAGGAILPGIAMSARALAEQTDALPHVAMEQLEKPPSPLGKSTVSAIEAGLYWGVVGAIRELISRLASGLSQPPELFVTGGASQQVAELLAQHGAVRHVPHLVLVGIALVDLRTARKAGE